MKHKQKYMDYLFFLYISGEPVQSDHIPTKIGQDAETDAKYIQSQSAVEQMKQLNLTKTTTQDGTLFIELTALGRTVTEYLADAIAKDMVDDWFDTQHPDSHAPHQQPA